MVLRNNSSMIARDIGFVNRTICVHCYESVHATMFVKVVRLEVNSTLEMGSENSMESDWLKSEA
jgi:hypothetical protein